MFIAVYNIFCHVHTHTHTHPHYTVLFPFHFRWSLSSSQLVPLRHVLCVTQMSCIRLVYNSMYVGFYRSIFFTTEENPPSLQPSSHHLYINP